MNQTDLDNIDTMLKQRRELVWLEYIVNNYDLLTVKPVSSEYPTATFKTNNTLDKALLKYVKEEKEKIDETLKTKYNWEDEKE